MKNRMVGYVKENVCRIGKYKSKFIRNLYKDINGFSKGTYCKGQVG